MLSCCYLQKKSVFWYMGHLKSSWILGPLNHQPKRKTKNNPKCSISYLLSNGVSLKCKTPSYGSVELVLGYLFSWGYLWRLRVPVPQIMGKETLKGAKTFNFLFCIQWNLFRIFTFAFCHYFSWLIWKKFYWRVLFFRTGLAFF